MTTRRQGDDTLAVVIKAHRQLKEGAGYESKPGRQMTTQEGQGFIVRNWIEIAGQAYWGYSQQGRGVMIIFTDGHLPDVVDWEAMLGFYINDAILADLERGSRYMPPTVAGRLRNMVAMYSPDRDAVVCLANVDRRQWLAMTSYHPTITAKEAFDAGGSHYGVSIG